MSLRKLNQRAGHVFQMVNRLGEYYSRRVSLGKPYQAPPWQHMAKNPEILRTWHIGWILEAVIITIC